MSAEHQEDERPKAKKNRRVGSKQQSPKGKSKKKTQQQSPRTETAKTAENATAQAPAGESGQQEQAGAVDEKRAAQETPPSAEQARPSEQEAGGEKEAPETEAAQETAAEKGEEAEAAAANVYDLLREFATVLSLFAWQRLGLMMDPQTGKIHRDMAQARIAIDVVGYLVEQIRDTIGDDQRRALEATLADLRINFVQQSKRS